MRTNRAQWTFIASTLLVLGVTAFATGCDSDEDHTPLTDASVEGGTGGGTGDSSTEGGSAGASPDARAADVGTDVIDDGGLAVLRARGDYLVNHVIACPDCHTPPGANGAPDTTKFLAGNPNFIATPGGNLGSRNLTNDATGLKNRTDAEIKNMILNGVRPTATGEEALNPIMPYYSLHNMTDADANAIVAYLRTVPAVENAIPQRALGFDVPLPAKPIDPSTIPTPAATFPEHDSAVRGQYLAAKVGLCIECHTKHQEQPADGGVVDVLDSTKFFQGGEDYTALFATSLMIKPVSKNLTSDVATGLGSWTATDIVNAITIGKSKDGTGICPPMPAGPMGAYGGLHPEDALDIANYIRSLPAATHSVPDMCVWPVVAPADGGAPDAKPATDAGAEAATTSDAAAEAATSSDAATEAATSSDAATEAATSSDAAPADAAAE